MHYGLTEASRSAFMEFHDDIDHLASVGKPSPHTDIRIMSDDGAELSAGNEGEICIRGEHVSKGTSMPMLTICFMRITCEPLIGVRLTKTVISHLRAEKRISSMWAVKSKSQ